MNAGELKRLLARAGATFENHRGGGGHLTVWPGDRTSECRCMVPARIWVLGW